MYLYLTTRLLGHNPASTNTSRVALAYLSVPADPSNKLVYVKPHEEICCRF